MIRSPNPAATDRSRVTSTAHRVPHGPTSPVRVPNRLQRAILDQRARRAEGSGDEGLTLVELMVAFACLIILITLAASALTTYLTAGTTVISSYSATDTLLPSSITIQRLIRSEVEPGPTLASGGTYPCGGVNVPCPAFLTGSVGTYSTTFYANIGDPNGPAKIVMSESTPTTCGNCKFYTSVFTVMQYRGMPETDSGHCYLRDQHRLPLRPQLHLYVHVVVGRHRPGRRAQRGQRLGAIGRGSALHHTAAPGVHAHLHLQHH